MNFNEYAEVDTVARIHMSLNMDDFYDAGGEKEDAYEWAREQVSEFLYDLYEKVDGNMSNEVFYMDPPFFGFETIEDMEKNSGSSLEAFDFDFDPGEVYDFHMFVKFTRQIPAEDMDQICLSMDGYYFTMDMMDLDGNLITQHYDFGDYETRYYSQGKDENAVNKYLDSYKFGVKKLLGDSIQGSSQTPPKRVVYTFDEYKAEYPDNNLYDGWKEFESFLTTVQMLDEEHLATQHSKSTPCTITYNGKAIMSIKSSGLTHLILRSNRLEAPEFEQFCSEVSSMGFENKIKEDIQMVNIKGVTKIKDHLALIALLLRFINAK